MAFDVGGSKGKVRPSMNVTPLVDVVLVLLIIFMVITPMMVKQFRVVVPEKADAAEPAPTEAPTVVVLDVGDDGAARINGEVVPDEALADRVSRILAAKSDRSMFFQAADAVPYGRALDVLDLARAGGSNAIAVLTELMEN